MDNTLSPSLTKEEVDLLLSKYFKTLEQQKIESDEQLKQVEIELQSDNNLNDNVLSSLQTIEKNTQLSNNIFYAFGIFAFVFVISLLFYKFLKFFI